MHDPESTELLITALMLIELADPQDERIWQAHGMIQALMPGTSPEDRSEQLMKAAEISAAAIIQRVQKS